MLITIWNVNITHLYLPFIKSKTKQSLSGVWKAYVIHTMNGLFTCKVVHKNKNSHFNLSFNFLIIAFHM